MVIEASLQGISLQVVLMTLTVYVEWVSVQHIFADDGKLLKSLCFLLSEDNLKMEAAECLLQVSAFLVITVVIYFIIHL